MTRALGRLHGGTRVRSAPVRLLSTSAVTAACGHGARSRAAPLRVCAVLQQPRRASSAPHDPPHHQQQHHKQQHQQNLHQQQQQPKAGRACDSSRSSTTSHQLQQRPRFQGHRQHPAAAAAAAPAAAHIQIRQQQQQQQQQPLPSAGNDASDSGAVRRESRHQGRFGRREEAGAAGQLQLQPEPEVEQELELCVGGRVMRASRVTLLQVPGSRLAAMFDAGSGSSSSSAAGSSSTASSTSTSSSSSSASHGSLRRDSAGRVCLDVQPELFERVLGYLVQLRTARERRAPHQGAGAQGRVAQGGELQQQPQQVQLPRLPEVAAADQPALRRLLSLLGLLPFTTTTTTTTTAASSAAALTAAASTAAAPTAAGSGAGAGAGSARSARHPHPHRHHHQHHQHQQHSQPQRQWHAADDAARARRQQQKQKRTAAAAMPFPAAPAAAAAGDIGGFATTSGTDQPLHRHRHQQPASHQPSRQGAATAGGPPGPQGPRLHSNVVPFRRHRRAGAGSDSQGPPQQQQPQPQQEEEAAAGTAGVRAAGSHSSSRAGVACPAATAGYSRRGRGEALWPGEPPAPLGDAPAAGRRRNRGGGGGPRHLSPPAAGGPTAARGGGGGGGGGASAAVSQLYYISTEFSEARGLKVAVHTEQDLRASFDAADAADDAEKQQQRGGSSSSSSSDSSNSSSSDSGGASPASAAAAAAAAAAGSFDMFVDTTYGGGGVTAAASAAAAAAGGLLGPQSQQQLLSMTFVSRRPLPAGGVFLGLTSAAQLDRRGAAIPCYGWKSNGCTYNDGAQQQGRASSPQQQRPPRRRSAAVDSLGSLDETIFGPIAGSSSSRSLSPGPMSADGLSEASEVEGKATGAEVEPEPEPELEPQAPLWAKGDSVELLLRAGGRHCQLVLKVNGRTVDVINRLPLLRNWCWYLGLWAGGDVSAAAVSAAVLQRDQYAVYWGDYCVRRFL
ncbi:hypothetical protein HXX76_001858 [Chlamydomonas incerta]|uniref:Potassium channel tetramerisation-type BTB domain-containing protein n=1 Tax=Chlamydomonas incerta TaxID=51695 RepID=A0A835TQJ6_CHLIN|nr:hypothetical protein HXX76_001858 [Chlamydomonas incerta]|eukprot:KAG2443505.1 hypothetical protein HXX76_001858 [Chlamydomonas incerta]